MQINLTKSKKNYVPTLTPKVVQTKITLKANSPPPAKGVLIQEPSPNPARSTTDKVVEKGKGKVVEPPPKVKSTSTQVPSSSKAAPPGSHLGEKMSSSDSRSSPVKKLRTGIFSSPFLAESYEPGLRVCNLLSREAAALVLPPEIDNGEAIAELFSAETIPTSYAMVEPNGGTLPSQASAEPTSSKVVLEPTARTFPI
ncbi:hypothetical protein Adt_39414 [Abeliophyllum distichum]|uniref:Uncharacterized protein n=1 Tax=Abeliophyllum distichum TaxID=126358 RepID=A0ABD1Q6Q2_9LAMI